ncbi:hypothetical protein GLOIN_2v1868410 [Rhizophagus irregularis DAOM 181602=DAOM 197198]|nr:hypothetical protein GLOIN_2v1868410 [Rhizophagus irregularis DAOM 181602=DAOM 197198]
MDDLQMKEIEVWEHVLKWGLAQNPTLIPDPKGTEEILGGYNPLKWESTNSYGKTEDSFIFSFKNKHIKDVIISKVKDKNYAIFYKYEHGPQFGGDIVMSSSNEFIDYETISYQQDDYEKKFSMEDYEVFQIIKK